MKFKLIENWKQAWKYISVQIAAVILFLPTLAPYMPEIMAYIPTNWYQILGGAILIARIVKQRVDEAKKD